jgi:ribonuclease BN (tRNA processing enzyme)
MRLTVLGGCGAWPVPGQGCSGYLAEHDGYRVLIDPGYGTMPRLPVAPDSIDAVLISHGHPDHCADLNPLLRARALGTRPARATVPRDPSRDTPPAAPPRDTPPATPAAVPARDTAPARPLPVWAPPGALDAVMALDVPGMLDAAADIREFSPGQCFAAGPFAIRTWPLPHWVTNAGFRIEAGHQTLAYTGDTGPSPLLAELAGDAGIFLAEATYPDEVPPGDAAFLSSASQAGRTGRQAGAARLVLTHLWPGTDPEAARAAAASEFPGGISVAVPGLEIES